MAIRVFSCILLVTWISVTDASIGGVYTFPVKSVNLPASAEPDFFTTADLYNVVEDAHAVDGVQTVALEGGYVVCGKGIELKPIPGQAPSFDAFVTKFSLKGEVEWAFTPGHIGSGDACNSVAELPNGDILAVGYQIVGADGTGVAKRTIYKLNGATGKKIWTADNFGDATLSGAFEMINLNSGCGNGALLSGFLGKKGSYGMDFKSYGNTGGVAVVMHIPLAALEASTPPTSAQVSWSTSFPKSMTAKTAHCTAKGQIPVLLWGEKHSSGGCSLAIMDSKGAVTIAQKKFKMHGEGTDMNVDEAGEYAYITGHGKDHKTGKGYLGRLTKVKISDASSVWTQTYQGGGGNINIIYNECFGIAMQKDGMVLSCGTGIEDCTDPKLTPTELKLCKAGKGDLRPGALTRKAGIWQLLIIKADFSGKLLWQSVMSYRPPNSPELNTKGWESISSGGEWPIATKDGGIAIVADQQSGIGILKLKSTPRVNPPKPPITGCQDNNAGVDSSSGGAITGCAGLAPAGFKCDHMEHGKLITQLCPKTCMCSFPACCGAASSLAQTDTNLPETAWSEKREEEWSEEREPLVTPIDKA